MSDARHDSERTPRAENIRWHAHDVTRGEREQLLGQRGRLLWLTGLSGSGKSTVAVALDAKLNALGRASYLLDGDNIRYGLCDDLGFAPEDRQEHVRRVGEVGRLFVDAGVLTVAAFISPYRADRDRIRERMKPGDFVEVYISTPLEVCEGRDPKGLYVKARAGQIGEFTGISAPYEAPISAELTLDTSVLSVEEAVDAIVAFLQPDWV
ncbi:MAG: adenylyl-sulfate kinase [Myxococcales bacterium]|nr:adenylyl-sulfate kinase [Myxococcales bacterium]MCB9530589.1 adenylyl-sulfate kinase [Myxococcales bacterium]MCB9532676.1 adenylyl-sulfate kinase [Myxococcales bacterium]